MEVHMEGEGTKQIQIFTWLALQLKLPSADRIIKQGRQANPICALCRTTDESHIHMFAKCTYTSDLAKHCSMVEFAASTPECGQYA
jgi:hypothetical protein